MGAGNEKKIIEESGTEESYRKKFKIIWIDPKDKDKNNNDFLNGLKNSNNVDIIFFRNTKDSIVEIKKIEFEDLYIIIYEKLCKEFIEKLKENINDIYVIPKIILFLDNKEKFMNENKEYINNNPFYFNFMITNLNVIQKIIISPRKKENSQNFIFEYKDKKLFNMNKDISFFLEILDNIYSKNDIWSSELNILINQIKYLDNIPLELLSKYFLRIYCTQSDFCMNLNKNLRQNKLLYYMPYIITLYEGIKLKSLSVISHNILYSNRAISNDELQILLNKFNNKKENILTNKIVSNQFLSSTESEKVAKCFLENIYNKDKAFVPIFLIIEKDYNIDLNKISFSNATNISPYKEEKEVVFFPFSSFEIKSITKENLNNEINYYKINLKYLGCNNSSKELLFNTYFSKNDLNKDLNNKKVIDDQNELKKKIEELNNEILDLNNKLVQEKNLNNKLTEKIKDLENIINNEKEKNSIKNENNINDNYNKDRIIELFEEIRLKDKEIKFLQQQKSRYPFELLEGEKIMSIIISSEDENIQHSIICKNKDIFNKIEDIFYEKYAEYRNTKETNIFKLNGKKIDRYKTLEENKIENHSIIILYKTEN